ncbi:MAG: alpha-amylase [Culturomica sp.]|jgi:1,4-alpha-glucan branching enzyme|nr:alpha-amylase [Culturomica sp.]
MRTYCYVLLLMIWSLWSCSSSSDVPVPTPEPPEPGLSEGFHSIPEDTLRDNEESKIIFKAPKSSALYGYTGDVYAHIGVVEGSNWLYVPAEWDENIAKCKMVKEENNVWSLTLSPTLRTWFGATANDPISKVGVVVRSADGLKKGQDADYFFPVKDNMGNVTITEQPLPDGVIEGINIINSTTVTLVFYDLDKQGRRKDAVYVIGDFNDWTISNSSLMKRDESAGCWWLTLTGLDASTEYAFQYYVKSSDGNMRLADPYTEKVLDPDDQYIPASTYPNLRTYPADKTNGIISTFKIQSTPYNWQVTNFEITDKNNLVIYELLLRDFSATGDLAGALAKLDYLKSLGVNVIELMPVQEFEANDSWGYNPDFFFAMDKAYGTKEQYKNFIDECHKKGIAVILDVVYNHAVTKFPYVQMYWNSEAGKPSVDNPWFNTDAPHPFSVFNDFNHESPVVRKYVKRNLKFLCNEYKFDGFRFDLAKGFTQNSSDENTASRYDASRVVILKDYHSAVMEANPKACVILELFTDENEEKVFGQAGMKMWRNVNYAYGQSAMGWTESSAFTALTTQGTTMPFGSWVGYMESHDEEREAYRQSTYGNGVLKTDLSAKMKQLQVNAAFFFTVAGPKMLWQFGELGYDVSIDENGRTGKKPLHWEYYDVPERRALHDTYAKLIKLRFDHPELFASSVVMSWQVAITDWTGGRFITLQSADGKKVVVAGNFTNENRSINVPFPTTGIWTEYMSNTTLDVNGVSQTISIPANEFRLYTSF